jgi:hypothetical protein
MRTRASTGKIRQTYEFIKANRNRFDVRTMCRVLEVAPSGYYAWLQEPVCQRAIEDLRLLRLIRASFTASRPSGGRRNLQQAPCDATDARQQDPSGPRVSNPAQLCIQALRADSKRPAA